MFVSLLGQKMTVGTDPSKWLDEHGDALFKYAFMRVRNEATAEDLVQETLLAAIQALKTYQGQSSERTWLIGILKHKTIDYFRKAAREIQFEDDAQINELVDAQPYDERGQLNIEIKNWSQPEKALEQDEFWRAIYSCLDNMPQRFATIFLLREVDGFDTDDLCKTMDMSQSNLWTTLSRIRKKMQICLDVSWFNKPVTSK